MMLHNGLYVLRNDIHVQCSVPCPCLQSVLSKFSSAGVLFNTKEESNRFFLAKFQMQQGCMGLHVAPTQVFDAGC